jgi:hypothetical protein
MALSTIGELARRSWREPTALVQRLRCLVINRVEWPESEFLYDRQRKFLYCPIAKVACSSIKRWFLAVQACEVPSGADVHMATRPHRLRELPTLAAWNILGDPTYFRLAFVRNPWARLVSAYLNKFLGASDCAQRFAARHRRGTRLAGSQEPFLDLSFAEFLHHLARGNPARFDVHWRPQYLYLKQYRFDFLGRFEHLAEDFARIQQRLGTTVPLPRCNATCYEPPQSGGPIVADWTPRELQQQTRLPGYRQFYTRQLRELVSRLYAEDIDRFGYEFDDG